MPVVQLHGDAGTFRSMQRKLPHQASSTEPWDDWSASVSGAPGTALDRSVLDWEGRRFLAGAAGTGSFPCAIDPVRVFAGMRHADTPAERARLAVSDLERLGGLERRVLIVGSPTG